MHQDPKKPIDGEQPEEQPYLAEDPIGPEPPVPPPPDGGIETPPKPPGNP